MPYVDDYTKNKFQYSNESPKKPGELNYIITLLIQKYTKDNRLCYNTINEVMGVLECAKQEYYRRVAVPYEEKKKQENGDVYITDITK